jgi:hypothetical protein
VRTYPSGKAASLFSACIRKPLVYLLATLFLLPTVSAAEIAATPTQLVLPDGTPVRVQLAENISSARAHVGDRVNFVVVQDVSQGGFTVIPAGTKALGSVTAVKGRRFLGIGGKVSLELDSLELANGDLVGLRASKEVKGGSRTKLMVAGMIAAGCIFLPAAPILLLTRGQQSTAVKSTEITAQIDGDTPVLTASLQPSPTDPSELDAMMDYLPPRVFNAEGREGDMLNLVFVAQTEDLQAAFARAGWVETDQWKPAFVWHLLRHRTNDAALPMARFYLFGRVQDYSYALPDPSAVVSRRHHLRIWKTGSTLDGTPVWAGAATHDVAIVIARHGRLVDHRIDPAVDMERDFIGTSLTDSSSVSRQEYVHGVDPVFEAQTASGESYHSDSRILLLDLHKVLPATNPDLRQGSAMVRPKSLSIPISAYSFPEDLLPTP